MKAEVQNVHEISARSKADLAHVTEHRGEVATLKGQVDLLLSRIGETDERIVAIDAKRKLVDEVQTKANAIVHVLDDVRINLETMGEQKAVIDHVAEKVAQLEFTLQEARNTLARAPARARAGRAYRAGHQSGCGPKRRSPKKVRSAPSAR